MQIEAGKHYKTRDGRKVGPMVAQHQLWVCGIEAWYLDGKWSHLGGPDPDDLIAEWTEGPVRTVTRREIVGGKYGRVRVNGRWEGGVIVFVEGIDHPTGAPVLTAPELRAAAATFLELAEALEDVG